MTIHFSTRHLEVTDVDQREFEQKTMKFVDVFPNIIQADIHIEKTTSHHHKGDIFAASLKLNVPHKVLFASREEDSVERAFAQVFDAMMQELTKYKETHAAAPTIA